MDWNLRPGLGAGPIKFRMTRAEIGRIIGAPVKCKVLEDNEVREFRGSEFDDYDLILHYKNDLLTCIIFPFACNEIQIFDRQIYKSNPQEIVNLIKVKNGNTLTIYNEGDFYFKNIFIVLHQFFSEEVSNKALSLWSRDGFDEIIVDMDTHWRGREA